MEHTPAPSITCVSLGMVIMDEIHMPNRPPLVDVLGGSASFVTLGQRLFAEKTDQVGCLIIAGDDFPGVVRQQVESWGTKLVVKTRDGEKSTRGKLVYIDDTFGRKCSFQQERHGVDGKQQKRSHTSAHLSELFQAISLTHRYYIPKQFTFSVLPRKYFIRCPCFFNFA
jgi:hypothetical protein